MENKNSFFSLVLDIPSTDKNPYKIEKLSNAVDLIFSLMKVSGFWYQFRGSQEIVYFFKTEDRKRKGQLVNYCQKILPSTQEFQVEALSKFAFEKDIARFQSNENYKEIDRPVAFRDYTADDIRIFEDSKNWYPWQKEVYSMIFNSDGTYKKPHNRWLYSIVDTAGNTGKSSFFKYLFFKNPTSVARLTYGSASQLRSSAVNIGEKKLYIVDLTRAKSVNDKEQDLLSALEDIKNGFVTNAMYGSGKTLMMEPPHILVSSNYALDYSLLSSDRWKVYEITKTKKLREQNPAKISTNKKGIKPGKSAKK